jgi:hypothetical protein
VRELVTTVARHLVRVVERSWGALTGPLPALYHITIVLLSAAVASSLPFTFSLVAQRLLLYWSVVENEKIFLISTEVAVAVLLIVLFGRVRTNIRSRALSRMARTAGMEASTSRTGLLARRTARRMKERQALMRDLMINGSTGFRTMVDPKGDLHTAIRHCRSAAVMLLNPESRGAVERARTIPDRRITQESLRSQIRETIAFLGTLRAAQKSVRLKLYGDPPLFKLAILGDYAWVQHYHPGLDVQALPEFLFRHDQNPASLYTAFYQYFVTRWNDPAVPEYDFLSEELVYRDEAGQEVRREKLDAAPLHAPATSVLGPRGEHELEF